MSDVPLAIFLFLANKPEIQSVWTQAANPRAFGVQKTGADEVLKHSSPPGLPTPQVLEGI